MGPGRAPWLVGGPRTGGAFMDRARRKRPGPANIFFSGFPVNVLRARDARAAVAQAERFTPHCRYAYAARGGRNQNRA